MEKAFKDLHRASLALSTHLLAQATQSQLEAIEEAVDRGAWPDTHTQWRTINMDRLTPERRKHAERHSERKAFGDATAISEALQRALAFRQGNVSSQPTKAHHGNPATAEAHQAGPFLCVSHGKYRHQPV